MRSKITRIKSLVFKKDRARPVEIFGHTSRGLPGIDIIGLGKHGKYVKEKFIFLSKRRKLKIPFQKYTICVESYPESINKEQQYAWTEVALLLIFWSLCGVLPIQNLEDCFICGIVKVNGQIYFPNVSENTLQLFYQNNKQSGLKNLKYITMPHSKSNDKNEIFYISVCDLFSKIPLLQFNSIPSHVIQF